MKYFTLTNACSIPYSALSKMKTMAPCRARATSESVWQTIWNPPSPVNTTARRDGSAKPTPRHAPVV